ncbi:MAG: hypothetical protein IPK97_00940 [Ahniella sp.]|nr:hypothetical protein [Ahniella sp.]
MKITYTLLFAIGLTLAGSADAFMAKQPSPAIPKQFAATEFDIIAKSIRIQMEPGGRFAYVPKIDRPAIEDNLKEMSRLLDGVEVIEELAHVDRIRLFNAQEKVNGLLLQHDGDRLVCEKTKVTGSHRPRTVCMTYNEKRAARETVDRMINNMQRTSMPQDRSGG